jgi:hypothetical protein
LEGQKPVASAAVRGYVPGNQDAMKRTFFTLLATLPLAALWAGGASPSGEYAELHACEVYTGGCTASAQATLGGRSVLRVWNFQSGQSAGADLAGQTVMVLEVANENLAMPKTQATHAVAYLPESTSAAQRDGLLAWLKESGVRVGEARVVPVSYQREGARIVVSGGSEISFATRALEACDSGSCGEQLWYEPRGRTDGFTVLVNQHSSVSEPALKLSWKDHSAKSVFFGKFGEGKAGGFQLAGIL